MPFTLVHGLVPYLGASALTKDWKLRLLAFLAGMAPDLDGIPLLFNMGLYRALHRELFHQPVWGLVLAIPVALFLHKYYGMDVKKSAVVFAIAFISHPVTDLFFTGWPIRMLWPFSTQLYSFPAFVQLNWLLALGVAAIFVVQQLGVFRKVKERIGKKQAAK